MREDFWNELNESRELLVPKMWKGVFPEADNINFHTLVEINQYKASVSNNDQLLKGTAHIPGVEFDATGTGSSSYSESEVIAGAFTSVKSHD